MLDIKGALDRFTENFTPCKYEFNIEGDDEDGSNGVYKVSMPELIQQLNALGLTDELEPLVVLDLMEKNGFMAQPVPYYGTIEFSFFMKVKLKPELTEGSQ